MERTTSTGTSVLQGLVSTLTNEQSLRVLWTLFEEQPCAHFFESYAKGKLPEEPLFYSVYDLGRVVRAAEAGDINYLKQSERFLNMPDRQGNFPITAAAKKGHQVAVEFLLGKGCNPYVENREERSAEFLARQSGNAKLGEILANAMTNPILAKSPYLSRAIDRCDQQEVSRLLREGVSVHQQNAFGETALHEAAKTGQKALLEMVLSYQPEVNIQNVRGETPLHHAVAKGAWDCVVLLLEHKASLTAKDDQGKGALDKIPVARPVIDAQHLVEDRGEPSLKKHAGESREINDDADDDAASSSPFFQDSPADIVYHTQTQVVTPDQHDDIDGPLLPLPQSEAFEGVRKGQPPARRSPRKPNQPDRFTPDTWLFRP